MKKTLLYLFVLIFVFCSFSYGHGNSWRKATTDWTAYRDQAYVGGTPVAGTGRIYVVGNDIYFIDQAGTSTSMISGGFSNPMTTRGDIIYVDSSGTTTRLPIGAAGQVLKSDGTDLAYGTDTTGAGSGAFSDAADPVVLNTTSKDVQIGDAGISVLTGKVEIGGDADQPQLIVEGHTPQTDDIFIVQQDDGTQVFAVSNNGIAVAANAFYTSIGFDGIDAVDLTFGSADITGLDFVMGTAAGNDFTINTDGLVFEGDNEYLGIGTAVPNSPLDVVSLGYPQIEIEATSGGGGHYHIGVGTTNLFKIKDLVANEDRFAIDINGNVGIGTSTPTTKLEVTGTFTVGNGTSTSGVLSILEDADNGSEFVSFRVPALTSSVEYTLPPDDGNSGEVLQTNGSGVLTWEVDGGGGGNSLGTNLSSTTNDIVSDNGTMTIGSATTTINVIGTMTINGEGLKLDADDTNTLLISTDSLTAARTFNFPDDELSANDLIVGTSTGGSFVYTAKSSINLSDFNDDLTHIYTSRIAFIDPTAADDFFFDELFESVTFTDIYAKTLVGTVNFDITVAGVGINGSDITATTSGVLDSSLAGDTTGAAGEEIKLEITSVASSPTYIMIILRGTY